MIDPFTGAMLIGDRIIPADLDEPPVYVFRRNGVQQHRILVPEGRRAVFANPEFGPVMGPDRDFAGVMETEDFPEGFVILCFVPPISVAQSFMTFSQEEVAEVVAKFNAAFGLFDRNKLN